MYIVKADNPDVGYVITPPTVTDSEGNPVPVDSLVYETVSDNPDVLTVNTVDPLTGTVHFGAPGVANINVQVKDVDGDLLGSFGAQFTLTAGDPATIVGGAITFEGLTEV